MFVNFLCVYGLGSAIKAMCCLVIFTKQLIYFLHTFRLPYNFFDIDVKVQTLSLNNNLRDFSYNYSTGVAIFIRDILGKLVGRHIQKFSPVGVQFQLRSEISDNVFSPKSLANSKMASNCLSRGKKPVFLRKLKLCDFPGVWGREIRTNLYS